MNTSNAASKPRAIALWLISTAALVALARWQARGLSAPLSEFAFEAVLLRGCAVVLALSAAWAWLVTSVVVVEVLRRSPRSVAGVPRWARAVVLVACGVAAAGVSAPAGASSASGGDLDLDGLPLPDRASGGFLAQTVRPELRASAVSPPGPTDAHVTGTHVVGRGESLWSIASKELGDPQRWIEVYRLNRAVIGPDPDLITPDQRLDLPHTP